MLAYEFVPDLIQWEGCVPWLYCDVRGYVTIGIGNLVKTANDAAKLPLVHANSLVEATGMEKFQAWIKVSNSYNHIRPAGAKFYASCSDLRLTQEEITKLVARRLERDFLPGIKLVCPNFHTFPEAVQKALVDIAYNCGVGGFHDFRNLIQACNSGDFKRASRACHRKTSRESRNNWTRDLLLSAA